MEALSLATSSSSKVLSRLSMFKYVDVTLRLTMRRRSVGSLVSSTEESIAPYDSDSTPRDFKLLMRDSVLL